MKKIILILIVSLFFISCSNNYKYYSKKVNTYFKSKDSSTNFDNIIYELTSPICKKLNEETTLYITDYVNEEDLKNKSKLGFLLSNETKVKILESSCSKDIVIQDLQLSKNLKISNNGSRILTRNINDIKINTLDDDKQILIGSYLFTNNQIIFFLKLVNLKSGNIISTTSATRMINDEFKALEGIKTTKDIENDNNKKIYTPMHL